MSRLPVQPGELLDRATTLSFTFDGRAVEGFAGDTIGSALYASGQRTFSRSFKYHRRRGLLGGSAISAGTDLVDVDGRPGVRAATEPLRDGMVVGHLNAFPRLDFDVMRATDLVGGPFTPVGFYYKTFIRPRRLWPVYEKVLRHAAGLGRLRRTQEDREWRTEYRRRHADVLVVGGGAAGLAAARAAALAGADVVLVDEGPEPGGRLLDEGARDRARALTEQARAAGVEILTGAPALGCFDGLVPVWQGDTLHQVRTRRIVVATGVIEQPLVFADNDRPGVMLSCGALSLLARQAVLPGTRAVVATTSDRGLAAALQLHAAGVAIAGVADLRPDAASRTSAAELRERGVPVMPGITVVAAEGDRAGRGVTAAAVAPVDRQDAVQHIPCDLIVVSGGEAPAASLALQAGARTAYDAARGHFALVDLPADLHAAGSVVGAGADAERSGESAGRAAAAALGLGSANGSSNGAREAVAAVAGTAPEPVAIPPVAAGAGRGKCFVDLDEDVTVKDVRYAIGEGFDSMELAKRYTTVTMGPSQGRFSSLAMARLMSEETGLDLATVGQTTARPPWVPVPMGVLAGRPVTPAKRSAIHGRHRDLGARVLWAGDWRRAYDYGDPQAEALNVHRAAGLIDVSTLGKLLVQGPDAGLFLDRMYPNRISDIPVGRTRYAVMVSEAGRITDDGTICRLDDTSFYVTTTSSGAGAVEELFGSWLADWGLDVHMTDVTQALGAVNVAGPRAREIMAGLTDLDLATESLGYMDARRAHVAGVPCLIMRIGFVGEVGFELHFPAALGEGLWDAISEAGAPLGLKPFGLEPQRILRLQKQHVLVGQDTDSETSPYEAGMPWVVKLDKDEDFIGRWALEHRAEADPETRLVGFTTSGSDVPTEGAAVLGADGAAVGRVTSSRWSPQLEQVIGLAVVPAALAIDGAAITLSDRRVRSQATVVMRPFYDPDGEVLRA